VGKHDTLLSLTLAAGALLTSDPGAHAETAIGDWGECGTAARATCSQIAPACAG
jgi:hypothetical protein